MVLGAVPTKSKVVEEVGGIIETNDASSVPQRERCGPDGNDPALTERYAQLSHPFVRLRDFHPPHRLRAITLLRLLARKLFQVCFQVALELLHRPMGPRLPPRGWPSLAQGLPQVGQRAYLVNQPEPLASLHPFFQGRQNPFRPNRRFRPVPAGSNPAEGCAFPACSVVFDTVAGWVSETCSVTFPPCSVQLLQAHYRPFVAPIDALTPARPAVRPSSGMNIVSATRRLP